MNSSPPISSFCLSLLVLLILCLYARTIFYDYVGLDDKLLIVDNHKFLSDLSHIKEAFTHDVFYNPNITDNGKTYYRPLLTLSLMIDAQFGGQSPFIYHITNIALHITACVLFFYFLKFLNLSLELSFFGAALLAAHPILSQAIGWIPGRNDSLLTVFTLATFIYLIQFFKTLQWTKLCLYFFFFFFALFTKETAVFIPLISFLYYFLIDSSKHLNKAKTFIPLITGYSVVGISWLLLRHQVTVHTAADLSFQRLSETFIENFPIYFQTIQKIIIPYNLSILSVPKDTDLLLSACLIGVLLFFLCVSKKTRWNYVLFGFAWFTIFLIPSFVVPTLTGFEHRTYLPFIGFLIIIFEMDVFKSINFLKYRSLVAPVLIVSLLSIVNFQHLPAFSNEVAFWTKAALNTDHSALAKMNYGTILAKEGRADEALHMYQKGLQINEKEPMIHNNIGILYIQKKMYREAIREFKEENRVNPSYSHAWYNLGMAYSQIGQEKEMIDAWNKTLAIQPNHPLAIKALYRYNLKKRNLGKEEQ